MDRRIEVGHGHDTFPDPQAAAAVNVQFGLSQGAAIDRGIAIGVNAQDVALGIPHIPRHRTVATMDDGFTDAIARRIIGVFDRRVRGFGDAGNLAIHRPGDIRDIGRRIADQLADGVIFVIAGTLGGYVIRVADTGHRIVDMIQLVGAGNIVIPELIHLVAGTDSLAVAVIGKNIPIRIIADILPVVRTRYPG